MLKNIKLISVFIIILFLIFNKYEKTSINKEDYNDLEYAKIEAMQYAKDDLVENCRIVYSKYDSYNKLYKIGCTNKEDNHAIMYIVTHNISKSDWFVEKSASQTGRNASDLFKHPFVINGVD